MTNSDNPDSSNTSITSGEDVSIGGDVVGRDKITQITNNVTIQPPTDNASQPEKQRSYLIGERLRVTREDIGLQPSEFIELIGFDSEKQYLQMERNEAECPESLIYRIFDATGNLPEWLKHSSQPKYNIDQRLAWYEQPDQAVRQIADISTGSVYVTIAVSIPASDPIFWPARNLWAKATDNYLHIGICVPIAKHKYRVFETHFRADFEDDHLRVKYVPSFYAFLRGLYMHTRLDSRGIILPYRTDEIDLYKGKAHPNRILFKHKVSYRFNWLHIVLDARDYSFNAFIHRNCGGWIHTMKSAFHGSNRKT